jgi:carboxypeptidase C (cathepsin A)
MKKLWLNMSTTFCRAFFKYFPDYFTLPFFITGESYAGHYIPALSYYIVQKNAAGKDPKLNLQGIAIGNGWVDPKTQYNYEPFAVQNALVVNGSREDKNLIKMYSACEEAINIGSFVLATDICNLIMEDVVLHAPKIDGYYINHYNIKEPCIEPSLCYDFSNQTTYMNLPATQKALGITRMDWESCSSAAGAPLIVDRIRPYSDDIPPVLAANVRVLVYSGMWDLICEYLGGEAWLSVMKWPGQDAFNQANYSDWKVNNAVAGHFKAVQGLTWLEVEKAGHMVPHDQPAAASNMLQHLLTNSPFSS